MSPKLLLAMTLMLTAAPAALADVQAPSGLVNSGSFDQAITPGASTEARSTLGEEEAAQTIQSDTRTTPDLKPAIPTDANASDFVPIDLTPVKLPERTSAFSGMESFKLQALNKLPSKMFLSATVENSLRFEANTYQTSRHYLSDMVYRVMPNVTVGYAFTKRTRVAANYFFFRDQYTLRNSWLSRNIHSVGGRIDHDIPLSEKTTLSMGVFPRFLFIDTVRQPNVMFNDIIPSVMVSRRTNNGVLYGSVMGQIRFRDVLSNFQEGDQFYSFGYAWRKGKYNFLIDNTLVTNFGNSNMRGGHNNQVIITTLEAGRRIYTKIPTTAFIRAEPIYNMGANASPGYAGFNFRIFGGLRTEVYKPAIFPIKLKG